MIAPAVGEVFVLYLHPTRRRQGIGTLLLNKITDQQRMHGATEQWVSVEPENTKGLPFYLARGFELRGERPAGGHAAGGRRALRLVRLLDGSDERPESRGEGERPVAPRGNADSARR